jgi:membrane protein required for colicin V production
MTFLDLLIVSTLLISVAVGAWRGWMPQALTLSALVCTVVATIKLGPMIANQLPLSGPGETLRTDLGAVIAMVMTLYVGRKLVQLHRHVFPREGPQPAHRTLGAIFGIASGLILLLAVAVVIDATELRDQEWWHGSTQDRAARAVIDGLKNALSH